VDKEVEFGLAANGISGIETAIGLVLAAVDAGRLPLQRAIAALTTGPAAVLAASGWTGYRGLVEGAPADLVVVDRSAAWPVESAALRRARTRRCSKRELAGQVPLAVANGRMRPTGTWGDRRRRREDGWIARWPVSGAYELFPCEPALADTAAFARPGSRRTRRTRRGHRQVEAAGLRGVSSSQRLGSTSIDRSASGSGRGKASFAALTRPRS
jgi:hypothetical protein